MLHRRRIWNVPQMQKNYRCKSWVNNVVGKNRSVRNVLPSVNGAFYRLIMPGLLLGLLKTSKLYL